MRFHIVRTNETIEEIMFLYSLNKKELVEENRHIKYWDRLVPGTKLKIPAIPEVVENDIDSMEPFIEDYYPKKKYSFNDDVIVANTTANVKENDLNEVILEDKSNLDAEVKENLAGDAVEERICDEVNNIPEEIKRMRQSIKEYEESLQNKTIILYPSYGYYKKNP